MKDDIKADLILIKLDSNYAQCCKCLRYFHVQKSTLFVNTVLRCRRLSNKECVYCEWPITAPNTIRTYNPRNENLRLFREAYAPLYQITLQDNDIIFEDKDG